MRTIRNLLISFRDFRRGPRRYIITVVLCVLLLVMVLSDRYSHRKKEALDYPSSLDKVVAVVNDSELTLRDMAYYAAYQEMDGQKRAELMNPDKPMDYWNLYVDKKLLKTSVGEDAIRMAVHDEIFYQMAVKEGITLSDEEKKSLHNYEEDFWYDLADYDGAQKLGITRDDIDCVMERISYAQRYQTIYARLHNSDYEYYDYDKEGYQQVLRDNQYSVEEKLWDKVDFGNLVVDNR